MNLLKVANPANSAKKLAARLQELRAELRAHEQCLKEAKEQRGAMFDAPTSEIEAAKRRVREIEDDISTCNDHIVGAEKMLREMRCAEYSVSMPKMWQKMREHYLKCHALALQIEAEMNAAAGIETEFRDASRFLSSYSKDMKTLSRPMNAAIALAQAPVRQDGSRDIDRRARSEIIQGIVAGHFTVGRTYTGSVAAEVFGILADMTPDDAQQNR